MISTQHNYTFKICDLTGVYPGGEEGGGGQGVARPLLGGCLRRNLRSLKR